MHIFHITSITFINHFRTHLATLSTGFGDALGANLLLVFVEIVSSLFVLTATDHVKGKFRSLLGNKGWSAKR